MLNFGRVTSSQVIQLMSFVLPEQEKRWKSRGADPAIEAFYTTEYASHYTRPKTAATRSIHPMAAKRNSGYGSNNHVSPLELEVLPDRTDFKTTTSHQAHCPESSLEALRNPRPLVRAAMEKSGYWNEPMPNVLYDSPARRVETAREREITAAHLDKLTLKRMTHHNPIDGENGGAGPYWGSTTYNTAYQQGESNHSKFFKMDRSLIGKREPDAFSREHILIPEDPVDEQASIYRTTYTAPVTNREIKIPDRVAMERSGYTYSTIPTQTKPVLLSDVTADELPSLTIHKMKRQNTTEFQNLYDPDPWKSTYTMGYQEPVHTIDRAIGDPNQMSKGTTGYDRNETVKVGPPGDPRWAKTGKTDHMKKFKDPTSTLRTRSTQLTCPNVMERSGYWGNG